MIDWKNKINWKTAAPDDIKGVDVKARDDSGNTPLHRAAEGGSAETIGALILAGADAKLRNIDGETPLHVAAKENKDAAVFETLLGWSGGRAKELLERMEGADSRTLHAFNEGAKLTVHAHDVRGNTPLHNAAESNTAEVMNVFRHALGKRLPAQAKDNAGGTPLHLAAKSNKDAAVTEALLAARAGANTHDNAGKTPLHYAAESNAAEVIEALLAAEAKPKAPDKDGKPPFYYMRQSGNLKGKEIYWRLHDAQYE